MPSPPSHRATLATLIGLTLFTVGAARAQSTGSSAVFEGRPTMAGPQSGLGAQSGPPQGGISPQTMDDARSGVKLQRPSNLDKAAAAVPGVPRDVGVTPRDPGVVPRDPGIARPGGSELSPQRDRDGSNVVRRDRDTGGLSDQGRPVSKAKRATKRTIERAKRGVGGVD